MFAFLNRLWSGVWFRKFLKYLGFGLLVWFAIYQFHLNYIVMNKNGIHGLLARKTWEQIQTDSVKAHAYDTIPTAAINQNW